MDDAVKAIKSAFLAVLVVSVIWGLAYPSATYYLGQRERARHLVAWLLLQEKVSEPSMKEGLLRGLTSIDNELRMDPQVPSRYQMKRIPISLVTPWPQQERLAVAFSKVNLAIASGFSVYSVQSDSSTLPLAFYQVVVGENQVVVVPSADWKDDEQIAHAFYYGHEPMHWITLRSELAGYSHSESLPLALTISSPVVGTFLNSIKPNQFSVLGISLDTGLFHASIGLLIFAIALSLLGPLRVVLNGVASHNSSWLLATETKGRALFWEASALALGGFWVAIPLVVLIVQFFTAVALTGFESVCRFCGMILLAASAVIFFWLAYSLRALRRTEIVALKDGNK
jgi:hypothetical protein